MRALLLFAIGLIFGTGFGYLIGAGSTAGHSATDAAHDHAGHADEDHDHAALQEWIGPPPTLSLHYTNYEDTNDINLQILTTGFGFAPELVNGQSMPGMGHAHVYVNGVKVVRAYGEWLQVPNVPDGATIRVVLSGNDHVVWAINGAPIAAELTLP